MIRLFVSQPMGGRSRKEIIAEREKAIDKIMDLTKEPIEVIDSFLIDCGDDYDPIWALGESIKRMARANLVYFVGDWRYARGCTVEHEVAVHYGIDRIED